MIIVVLAMELELEKMDYGLLKESKEFSISSGMTEEERKSLWNRMAHIFDNDIAPYMEFK